MCHHQVCKWPPKSRRSSRYWNDSKWYSMLRMLVCLVMQYKAFYNKFYYQQSSNCLPCSVFHQPHFSIAILCDGWLLSHTQTQVCTWVLARVNFHMCNYNQCHVSSLKNTRHTSVTRAQPWLHASDVRVMSERVRRCLWSVPYICIIYH